MAWIVLNYLFGHHNCLFLETVLFFLVSYPYMVFLLLCPYVFALFDFDVFHIQLSSDRYGICETYMYTRTYVCMYVHTAH